MSARRLVFVTATIMGAVGASPAGAGSLALVEPPALAGKIKSGKLPPIAARAPQEPLVVRGRRDDWRAGHHGGTLTLLMLDSPVLIYGMQ